MSLLLLGAGRGGATAGGAGVVVDNFHGDADGVEVSSVTSPSWTIGSDSNRVVYSMVATRSGFEAPAALATSIKLGGSGGTNLTSVSQLGTGVGDSESTLEVSRLVNPSSGSTTSYTALPSTGTPANPPAISMLVSVSLEGVNQSTPNGTPVTATGTFDETGGGDAEVTVTTNPGDFVLLFASLNNLNMGAPGVAAQTGSTLIVANDGGNVGDQLAAAAVRKTATGSSTTLGVTFTGVATSTGTWKAIAFVVSPA